MKSRNQLQEMAFLIFLVIVMLAWVGLAPVVWAANYYVDNAATGRNNGFSWTDAWTGFGKIQWSLIKPGDTIYVSGGNSSKSYYEPLVVRASGSMGKPVTIIRSSDAGHNGTVIIDGQGTIGTLIELDTLSYVTISGFTLQKTSPDDSGRAVYIDESQHLVVEDMIIQVSGRAGIFIQRSQNCILRHNRIETVEYVAEQTDGIYSQRNSGNIYENNYIVIRNRYEDGHNDGIQSYTDTSLIIRGNYVEQNNSKTVNAQGIFCTTLSGTFEVYNNIVYAPNTYNSLIYLKIPSPSFHAIVVSNTLIGSKWGAIRIEGDEQAVIKNNIVWDYNGGVALTYSGDMTEVSNNLFDRDPKLDTSFVPLEGSPALDTGATLVSPYDVDREGTQRPQGAGFDIGAIERKTSISLPPPSRLRVTF